LVDISVIVQERMNLDCEMNDDSRKRVLDECQASSDVSCPAWRVEFEYARTTTTL
jgi:hypothetical protein